ncbi:MAG TPA: hypothetical protein VM427_05185 [Patescibacteria group bacterium]|nr:hypothetical protein [Patescibacteria group bacterium]
MATNTVVCRECGAPAVPGRYACAECGSLLAAVTAGARTWGSGSRLEATPVGQREPDLQLEPEPEPEPRSAASGPEAAPDPSPELEARPDLTVPGGSFAGADLEAAAVADHGEPGDPSPSVLTTPSPPPTWPFGGDRGIDPVPTPRIPAGAYLPPSAVLDALDPPAANGMAAGGAPGSSRAATPDVSPQPTPGVTVRRLRGSFDLAGDTTRAVIAIGAAIGAIGFLLPWANVLAGAGLLGGYFTQWGLAGPGHWIALTLLVALVGVALAGPATARWPVGLGVVSLAALLAGMLWPYLFGFLGRSIGIWVVLAGAIVLAVGGVLDRLDRHDPDRPAVP